jgi:cell wall-associated NlpC family hydrolase
MPSPGAHSPTAAPARATELRNVTFPPGPRTLSVQTAVANLRREPSHAAELVSQLILGESVRVIEESRGWARVAGSDGYAGWTHAGSLAPADWPAGAPLLVWTRRAGVLREGPEPDAAPLCDLVLGARAAAAASGRQAGALPTVLLPGGSRGWAEAEGWVEESARGSRYPRSASALVSTALSLRGVPYLWGGSSSKAFDCSGFVQRAFGMHGIALPRDAWQQAEVGDAIEAGEDGGGLAPADLIFFAEDGTRVTHVAIALGEAGRIVHCSTSRAGVGVNSLDPADPLYALPLARSAVAARRVC